MNLREALDKCSFGGSFEGWERRKKFISEVIDKDGSFLDIGCGNGFLLRSIQEWSSYEIDPYGIDINPAFIAGVDLVYPDLKHHFIVLDSEHVSEITNHGLPGKFDYIFYSNIWGNISESSNAIVIIHQLEEMIKPEGKLIVAFYDEDKEQNLKDFNKLLDFGVEFIEKVENPTGTNLIGVIS